MNGAETGRERESGLDGETLELGAVVLRREIQSEVNHKQAAGY